MDASALEPGDLVLVKSRGVVSAVGRRIGGNPFDHVAVVVHGGQTLNIDKPRTRLLPADRLLQPYFEPLVLRPAWASPAARDAFVRWIEALAGREYDLARTLRLIGRLLLKRFLRVSRPLARPHTDAQRWICTDAVLLGLEQFGADHERWQGLPLDWNTLGFGTTNDFLAISERYPDLLRRVAA